MAQNGRPEGGWRVFEDPEASVWVVENGDGFTIGGCDLVAESVEVDGVVIVDSSGAPEGEMEVEQ